MKPILPVIFLGLFLAGSTFTSCKKHITEPPQDTTHKCDTCHTDTTHHPCDTCNINKDSAAHAFIWKEYALPSETNLTGVWVFGNNDILIVGGGLYHFDGVKFTDLLPIRNGSNTSLDGALSGFNIFAFSKTDYWLVHGSIALHTTDGKYFDDFRPGAVNACWGSAPNDVFIVGNGGHIAHYDGTKFTDMVSNTTKDIGQIWGTSDKNIWASGWNQTTAESVLLYYDGNSWTVQDLSKLGDIGVGKNALIGVWTCDSLNHHITVASGSFIYKTNDNGLWHSDTLQNSLGGGAYDGLNIIRGNSSTDIMVQGGSGFLSHWNGKTWYFYKGLFDWGNPSYDIGAFSFKGNTACMVGFKNGQGWMTIGNRR